MSSRTYCTQARWHRKVGLESSKANHHFASVCVEAARKGSTIFEYLKTPKSAAVAAWGGDRFDDDDDDAEFTPVGVLLCKNFLTHRLRPTSVTIGGKSQSCPRFVLCLDPDNLSGSRTINTPCVWIQ